MINKSNLSLWRDTKDYVVLDYETTGLSYKKGARVVEVCIYKIINGEPYEKYNTLVNPERHIPDELTQNVHGISDSMVRWAPNIRLVIGQIKEFIGDLTVVCHNVRFDWGTFTKPMFAELLDGYIPENNTLCTLEMSKLVGKSLNDRSLDSMYRFLTKKEPSLVHRSEPDVIMTLEVFQCLQRFVQTYYDAIYSNLK